MILMLSDTDSLFWYCVIMRESVFLCGGALLCVLRLEEVRDVDAGGLEAALLEPCFYLLN